jgi:hypothetical protein
MEPPKDDSGQVWFKLAQWFQRRRFLKKFTDGRPMPIAHTGELKIGINGPPTTYWQGSWSIFINVSIQDKRVRVMVFNATFNNISVISWQ